MPIHYNTLQGTPYIMHGRYDYRGHEAAAPHYYQLLVTLPLLRVQHQSYEYRLFCPLKTERKYQTAYE